MQTISIPSGMREVLRGGGVGELGVEEAGADVSEEAEGFAQGEEGGTLGLFFGREGFPFRAADGAEEDGVAGAAEGEGGLGQGLAVVIDAGPADIGGGVL